MTTEFEYFLGTAKAREVIWGSLCAVGRAVLFLLVGALAMKAVLDSGAELCWFLFLFGVGAAFAWWDHRS